MLKKRATSLFLSIVLLLATASSAAAAGSAGSADDPLISKSYIDSTYPGLVLADPLTKLTDSIAVLKYKINQANQSKAKGVQYTLVMPEGTVSLSAGSGFLLAFGSARLSSSSGTVIDLTDGITLASGQALSSGHRYLAAEHTTATVSVVTGAKLALFGGVTVSTGNPPKFTDVTDSMWHYSYVCYAVQKGLVNGRSEISYAPEDNLTIAEAIKLASCMNQLYNYGSVTLQNDPDVWYKTYVEYAEQNGIVTKTYSDYDAKITRSEFVAIFYAALPATEYTQINTVSANKIPDVRNTAENAEQIYTFYKAGILTGSDGYGTFYPNNNIKRSEVAAILTRMFEKDARQSINLA